MTLDPSVNKYVASFPFIREIQKKFLTKADECLIPKVESSNLDRSFGLCHATIVRCLRQVYKGELIYDENRKQTVLVHEEYNFVARNIWSSKIAHEMIKTKVNKGEVFERFFRGSAAGASADISIPVNEEKKDVQSEDSFSEQPEIGSLVSGSVEFDLMQPRPSPVYNEKREGISVRSIPSEDELEDELDQPESRSSSVSEESNHSIHEEEVKEISNPQKIQRKGSL